MADDGFGEEIFDDDEVDELDEAEDIEDEENEDDEDEPSLQIAHPEAKKSRATVRIRKVQYNYHDQAAAELMETVVGALRSCGLKKLDAVNIVKNLKGEITSKDDLIDAVYDLCHIASTEGVQSVLVSKKIGWNSGTFDEARASEDKETAKLLTPLEVVEGIYVCPKCKNTKTQHYSVQLRRADEPPTVFIHCVNEVCKFKWREG